ncbi:MAG: hypothetical protein LBC78_05625 [Oscillospiraceae bacterium]|nr:hypothetical protein [Oscillospiraceae bacterium]
MTTAYLDKYWKSRGANALRAAFGQIIRTNRKQGQQLLAAPENSFPVIYILAPVIESAKLVEALPDRVKFAMYITLRRSGQNFRAKLYSDALGGSVGEPPYEALKWMILTGAKWDGPSSGHDAFDAAIDLAAAYFAEKYDDPEVYSTLAETIFRRNRQGLAIHDLVWGFFHTVSLGALAYIARNLLSSNPADVDLTCELMGFEKPATQKERQALFDEYMAWLSEHRKYLYATGEYFNQTSRPFHVRHDREAKHISKEINPRDRTALTALTSEERQTLEVFRANTQKEM